MKLSKLFLSLLTVSFIQMFSLTSGAFAALAFDTCLQLYKPGVMAPVICLQGTAEEGVGGNGALLAVFATGSSDLIHCASSSRIETDVDYLIFIVDGEKELILRNVISIDGNMSGDAIIGTVELKFREISLENTRQLQTIANKNCGI